MILQGWRFPESRPVARMEKIVLAGIDGD